MSSSAGCAAASPRLRRSHAPPGGRGANSGKPILSPSTRRRRAVVVAAKGAKEGDNGWMKGLEGIGGILKRMPGVTIYQAAAPPPVLPGARVDFLEAMLQWHVGNSTSADLVLRDVQDAIVSEVTSFPVDKVALGESPSVAMHVPVPTLRQNPNGGPCNSQELGAAAMRMDEKRSSGGGASGASGSGPSSDDDSCDYASGEALVAGFPAWQGWTQPATALTLRAVLMTASALTAAAGMRQPVIGDPAKDARAGGGARLLKPQILFPEPTQELGDLREFFETLWPDAPYSFGTYGRDSVSSDDRYLKGDGVDGKKKLGRREKRLVIVVNVSSPGEESAAESDGEGMVNAAETLLELNVPFVVLTLWQDNSLVKSVQTKRARTEERDALRVLMERRTRILLGRSVRRKEARQKIRDAYARAVKMPQGKGYVALEEALAEAKAAGAEVGSEGDAMLAEIRSQARSAETDALAAALTSACLQVPVDVASLRANLQRARGVLEREEAEADEVATTAAAAAASESPASAPHVTAKPGALINMVYNDGVAASLDVGYSIDDDESGMVAPVGSVGSPIEEEEEEDDDDADPATPAAAGSLLGTMEDIDRFGAKKSDGGGDARGLAALRAAVAGAEAALEAVELEGDLRATLQDQGSLDVAAVPRLEALMLRAAKVAERKPPLTQEGAAKLNTLVSRCFSRATALQEMEGARASLAEALEPSLRGRDISPGSLEPGDVPRLEKAVARARTSAWPWQLEDAVAEAESTLERWRALEAVDSAMKSRSVARLRDAVGTCAATHPSLDLSSAVALLSELDAERAMEDGDQRLRTYFAASKVAWAGGVLTDEAAAMLNTIRQSLDITDAEHEQVTRAASAGSRTPEEAAAARSKEALDVETKKKRVIVADAGTSFDGPLEDAARIGGPGQRVSFSASGEGVRRPMFEGSEDYKAMGANDPDVESLWAEAVPDEGSAGEEVTVTAGGGDDGALDGSGGAGVGGGGGGGARGGWRRVGDTIIYNEEEIIGVGSSGTYVFRGYVQHTTRARHAVAVKRIQRPPGEEGRELLKLVEREVELLTALNQSPKVPFFHCWGITSSHVFIALELCTESLREHVTRRGDGMSVERRMDILRSVSSGIQWLHDPSKSSGCITHNDLKPENLLVDSTGEIKIADVGLGVQLQNTGKSGDKYTMSTFRKYGIDIVLAGRAPEMLKHQPLTPAADIWAMGVVFYFVLTGRASPFSESGRDVPTNAAIINGRHHLQNLMRVKGLHPRRALEARHLLASMLAPDPASRPNAAKVCDHPLFWDDDVAMRNVAALHARSASVQREMSGVLNDIATDALLSGASSGNSERGALLAAASMDLTDWKRMVDPGIRDRITKHLVKESPAVAAGKNAAAGNGKSKADVGRKPYGDGFADLLRFCRNAYEHPPAGDEIAPIVDALAEASDALESSLASDFDEKSDEKSDKESDARTTASYELRSVANRPRALLPPGVVQGMAYRRLTRRQRRALFAAYVTHLFPGLPLAVHECAVAVGAEPTRETKRGGNAKNGGGGGNKGAKQKGGVAAQQGTKAR